MSRTKMPFLPKAQAGEAPLSLLRRAASENGFGTTLSFIHVMHPYLDHSSHCLGTVARSPTIFRAICAAMGLCSHDVDKIIYDRTGCGRMDNLLWNGIKVKPGNLLFKANRLCVACYLKYGYSLAEWDHTTAFACAEHHVFLEKACPNCGTPWTWNKVPLACGCAPDTIIRKQRPCPSQAATLLRGIVAAQNQMGLTLFNACWEVVQWWNTLGIAVSDLEVAESMSALFQGKWPTIQQDQTPSHKPIALHPRVALAPLLSAADMSLHEYREHLLSHLPAQLMAGSLARVQWSYDQAMKVLGIGRVPFNKLLRDGHLEEAVKHQVQADLVNALLLRVSNHPSCNHTTNPLRTISSLLHQQSLSSWISDHSHTTSVNSGAKIEESATTPCRKDQVANNKKNTSDNTASLAEASIFLKTNPESIRGAIQAGLLAGRKGVGGKPTKWGIERASLETFNQRYVFGSALAREYGVSITTFSSRLRSAGLTPISGPGIDSGIGYIFYRKDLTKIKIQGVIKNPYHSPAGRRKYGSSISLSLPMSVAQAATILGISARSVRSIVRQNWIVPIDPNARYLHFKKASINALASTIKQDFLEIQEAADSTRQSLNAFRKTWINTTFIRCHKFANQFLIRKRDLKKIMAIWEEAATGSVIAEDLGRERWLCVNLKKMGRLQPLHILGSQNKKVYLYSRNDPSLNSYKTRI